MPWAIDLSIHAFLLMPERPFFWPSETPSFALGGYPFAEIGIPLYQTITVTGIAAKIAPFPSRIKYG